MNFDFYDFKKNLRKTIDCLSQLNNDSIIIAIVMSIFIQIMFFGCSVFFKYVSMGSLSVLMIISMILVSFVIALLNVAFIIIILGSMIEFLTKRTNMSMKNCIEIVKNYINKYKKQLLYFLFIPEILLIFVSILFSRFIAFEFASRPILMTIIVSLLCMARTYIELIVLIKFVYSLRLFNLSEYMLRHVYSTALVTTLVYGIINIVPFASVLLRIVIGVFIPYIIIPYMFLVDN